MKYVSHLTIINVITCLTIASCATVNIKLIDSEQFVESVRCGTTMAKASCLMRQFQTLYCTSRLMPVRKCCHCRCSTTARLPCRRLRLWRHSRSSPSSKIFNERKIRTIFVKKPFLQLWNRNCLCTNTTDTPVTASNNNLFLIFFLPFFGLNDAIIEGQTKMTFNQPRKISPWKNLSINCSFRFIWNVLMKEKRVSME